MPQSPFVHLSSVSRVYPSGGTQIIALDEVSLDIADGEWVAVTGPSGSGKTTLLNVVAGLDRPSSGTVQVRGHRIDSLSERRLTRFRADHVGLVFQDPHLLPGLTALENVVLSRLPWERTKRLEPRARQLLTEVGLGNRMDHPPAKLSAGERQRVGVARALLGEPGLLIADEPTGNLDARTTTDILRLLDELRQRLRLTLLVVTHDPAVAAHADRVARLVDGRLIDAVLAEGLV